MRAWPLGLVYSDALDIVQDSADYHARITHRHPTARAAASALAVGIAHSVNGSSVDETVHQMVRAAEKFDRVERFYKQHARKIRIGWRNVKSHIVEGQMQTSDMIRYAAQVAKAGLEPDEILGLTNKVQDNNRSFRGFLLGNEADEAVAAAVYIMVRHSDDMRAALIEAVNIPGKSEVIASLTGALVGARTGYENLTRAGFVGDIARLGNRVEMDEAVDYYETISAKPVLAVPRTSMFTWKKLTAVGLGLGFIVGGWWLLRYALPAKGSS